MIKAAFFDIDGTITKDLKIPDSFKFALNKLKEKEILCIIATGRHQLEIDQINLLEDLKFDAYLTLNGAYCFDKEGVFFDTPIDASDIEAIVKQIQVNPYPIMFIEKDKMYINMINDQLIKAQESVHMEIPIVLNPKRALVHTIYQLIPFIEDEKIIQITKNCQLTRWHEYACDIVSKQTSKKVGIQKCLEHYHIHRENTIAFGDGLNDIDMLEYVAIGVALGNAHQDVKEIADYITSSVHEDGVYKALLHYHII